MIGHGLFELERDNNFSFFNKNVFIANTQQNHIVSKIEKINRIQLSIQVDNPCLPFSMIAAPCNTDLGDYEGTFHVTII